MPGTKTQFKVGLFALSALVGVAAVVLALGLRARTVRIRYQTYFDESVQGLSVGSPVKFRGVAIGAVSDISIAPDHRQVSVGLGLERDAVRALGLASVAPDLRTQLAIQGITGVKFIEIDRGDPAKSPPPVLAFPPARNYIPSRPSLLKDLQGQLGDVTRDIPAAIEGARATFDKLGRLLDDVDRERLPARVASLADELVGATRDLRRWIADVQRAQLPDRATITLARVRDAAAKLDVQLTKLEPLIASARRASDSVGELGRSTRTSTRDLDRTIGELGDAARAFREFVDALEREPDMLIKGRRVR